jgi:predicted  nucleic acid-binding Zn-ribbon protein
MENVTIETINGEVTSLKQGVLEEVNLLIKEESQLQDIQYKLHVMAEEMSSLKAGLVEEISVVVQDDLKIRDVNEKVDTLMGEVSAMRQDMAHIRKYIEDMDSQMSSQMAAIMNLLQRSAA